MAIKIKLQYVLYSTCDITTFLKLKFLLIGSKQLVVQLQIDYGKNIQDLALYSQEKCSIYELISL
jgi:hypothetical protein